MQLVPVVSSNVAAIGYENGILEVRFKSGRTYRYYATESFFKEFLAAPSKGRFANQHLRYLSPIQVL